MTDALADARCDSRNALGMPCEREPGHDGEHRRTTVTGPVYHWSRIYDTPPPHLPKIGESR